MRNVLFALTLFFALTIANIVYFKARLAVVNNPYASSGSLVGNILSAAAAGNRADRERTLFVVREIAAFVLSGAILVILAAREKGS
ncbi:MAG: hypothetical protein JO024_09440 [Candidatus Eremiobacteraeota bacterium]|nr:hypothetical protein [Candidatus Eremiobacteraeota bacterium]MBV9737530.1 hypothetical protein [Candidatus Eremiobacteraeota bacterium]